MRWSRAILSAAYTSYCLQSLHLQTVCCQATLHTVNMHILFVNIDFDDNRQP